MVRRTENVSVVPQPSRSLDARGLYCPEPLFRAKTEMEFLNRGDVLEVWADDPAAQEDFNSWTRKTGQELLLMEKNGKVIHILVKKAK